MNNGFLLITRNVHTGGIYLETTDDWSDLIDDRRLIYCQAVSNLDLVQSEVHTWLQENSSTLPDDTPVNDIVSWLVSSAQWIANDHPLQSFRSKDMDNKIEEE